LLRLGALWSVCYLSARLLPILKPLLDSHYFREIGKVRVRQLIHCPVPRSASTRLGVTESPALELEKALKLLKKLQN